MRVKVALTASVVALGALGFLLAGTVGSGASASTGALVPFDSPTTVRSSGTTSVYVGNYRGSISEGAEYWEASWGGGLSAWIYISNGVFYAGCESLRDAHIWAYARRLSTTTYNVSETGGVSYLGRLVFKRPGRWIIYDKRNSEIGYTRGPHGVAAGLAWLGIRGCRPR